jgi:hypothetical protein
MTRPGTPGNQPPREPLDAIERELAERLARLGPHGEPPVAVDTRILAAAHAAANAAPRRTRRMPLALGVAASLVLALGLAWQLRPLLDPPPPVESESMDMASARVDESKAAALQAGRPRRKSRPPREKMQRAGDRPRVAPTARRQSQPKRLPHRHPGPAARADDGQAGGIPRPCGGSPATASAPTGPVATGRPATGFLDRPDRTCAPPTDGRDRRRRCSGCQDAQACRRIAARRRRWREPRGAGDAGIHGGGRHGRNRRVLPAPGTARPHPRTARHRPHRPGARRTRRLPRPLAGLPPARRPAAPASLSRDAQAAYNIARRRAKVRGWARAVIIACHGPARRQHRGRPASRRRSQGTGRAAARAVAVRARAPGAVRGLAAALAVSSTATLSLPVAFRTMIDEGFAPAAARRSTARSCCCSRWRWCWRWRPRRASTSCRCWASGWSPTCARRLYAHLISLDAAFFDRSRSGELVSRLTADAELLRSVVATGMSVALRSAVTFLGSIAMLFVTSPRLAAWALVGIPLAVLPIVLGARRLQKISRASQDRIADANAFASETLGAVRTVQAHAPRTLRARPLRRRGGGSRWPPRAAASRRRPGHRGRDHPDLRRDHLVLWLGAHDVVAGRMTPARSASSCCTR